MKSYISIVLIFLVMVGCLAQTGVSEKTTRIELLETQRPKLVVGIIVDQMRYDYLTRFESKYSQGGFMRLITNGFNCKNNHYNYIPTYTGPGHASVYTGTTPKYHGIISNSWYDKSEKKSVYCSGDDNMLSVGTDSDAGKMSPHRMVSTTWPDENKLFTQSKGKTIGISIKDRGAILPAGHTADAAYWYVGKNEGNFVSSSFYMEELPNWVQRFNKSDRVESYLKDWNTLYKIDSYEESGPDLNAFEGGYNGKDSATFPYDLKILAPENGNMDILRSTPYGNSIVTDFAIEAINAESLGKDGHTDVLAISYSSTDYIGHNFGVNSKEIQDTYLRLDLEIERLLNELDQKVGRDQYTVFLTSDHGAVNVPNYLSSLNIPSGYVDNNKTRTEFGQFLTDQFGSIEVIENLSNNQIFLDRDKLKELKLDLDEVRKKIMDEMITFDFIDKVYSAEIFKEQVFAEGIEHLLQNGYNMKRSGDILYVNKPAVIQYSQTGSTHGSGFNYDTHVPLIFYGMGIKKGSTVERTVIPDIAPTISALLGISFPSASTGKPLEFVLD